MHPGGIAVVCHIYQLPQQDLRPARRGFARRGHPWRAPAVIISPETRMTQWRKKRRPRESVDWDGATLVVAPTDIAGKTGLNIAHSLFRPCPPIPAEAGIQKAPGAGNATCAWRFWIPAFAGKTGGAWGRERNLCLAFLDSGLRRKDGGRRMWASCLLPANRLCYAFPGGNRRASQYRPGRYCNRDYATRSSPSRPCGAIGTDPRTPTGAQRQVHRPGPQRIGPGQPFAGRGEAWGAVAQQLKSWGRNGAGVILPTANWKASGVTSGPSTRTWRPNRWRMPFPTLTTSVTRTFTRTSTTSTRLKTCWPTWNGNCRHWSAWRPWPPGVRALSPLSLRASAGRSGKLPATVPWKSETGRGWGFPCGIRPSRTTETARGSRVDYGPGIARGVSFRGCGPGTARWILSGQRLPRPGRTCPLSASASPSLRR